MRRTCSGQAGGTRWRSGSLSGTIFLGTAYVFGMVFPLFVIALLWDRFNWAPSLLLRGRRSNFGAFGWEFSVHSTALASRLILIAVGAVVIVVAVNGSSMASSGWQIVLSAEVQHYAHLTLVWLRGLPGWVTAAALLAAFAGLVWMALRQVLLRPRDGEVEQVSDAPDAIDSQPLADEARPDALISAR